MKVLHLASNLQTAYYDFKKVFMKTQRNLADIFLPPSLIIQNKAPFGNGAFVNRI